VVSELNQVGDLVGPARWPPSNGNSDPGPSDAALPPSRRELLQAGPSGRQQAGRPRSSARANNLQSHQLMVMRITLLDSRP